ncbi:MAG: MarR family winged helix-turn-helix transcriptional regulator [Erythrobacter sp.]
MIPELGFRMSDNSRQLRRLFDERVRNLGLTAAQARLLLSLDLFPGENQGFHADRLEIEPITLTRMADRMEEAGWLERRSDPLDRRARILHLTEKSRDIVERLEATVELLFEDTLHGLSAAERNTLSRLLGRIGDNLTRARLREPVDG